MATNKTREKRRAQRLHRREIEKQKIEEQDGVDDEIEVVEPSNEVFEKQLSDAELLEKEGYSPPVSWDELEQFERDMEKADKVRRSSWQVSDLVSNILYSDMEPDRKGKAISDVGNGYSARIKSILNDKMEKEISDDELDVLQINSILSKDGRHTPAMEKFSDWISKAKLTTAAENKLSDSDFALVKDVDGKKVRKYPIHDKAHVRNALARAAQMIEEGGEAATDAKEALPKIRAAAKKMGIGQMEKSSSAIVVEKDSSGAWRAVMWPTNNFKDTDGEILSKEAHEEYVEWVSKNMNLAPVFTTWHSPDLVREHQVDFVDYESGFMLMSAPLTRKEAAGLLRAESLCDLGMSHGTIVIERDKRDKNVITKYRMVEVSDLPLENAANPFTDFSVISKEADMDKKKYLAQLLGEERADEFFEKSGLKQAELRSVGVEEKEKKQGEPPVEPPPAPPQTPDTSQNASLDIEAIVKAVGDKFDIEGLNAFVTEAKEAMEKVPVLEEVVKSLKEGEDDKLAEKISPPITQKMAWTRPSTSASNVITEDDAEGQKLVKQKPTSWFAEAVGVEPLEAAQ